RPCPPMSETLVVQVGRVVLYAAQGKGFDGPVADGHHVVAHHRLKEALGLQVVYQIVGVEGRTDGKSRTGPCQKDLLAAHLGPRRLGGIELAESIELGRRRKIQHLLKIGIKSTRLPRQANLPPSSWRSRYRRRNRPCAARIR